MATVYDRSAERDPDDEPSDWLETAGNIWRAFLRLLFKFIIMFLLVIICVPPNAEGVRTYVPVMGTPLHRLPIPGFSYLRGYEGLHRLDCAHLLAVGLLFAVCFVLKHNLWIILAPEEYYANSRWNPATFTKFMRTIGIIVVGADALIFYAGVSEQGGGILGSASFSWSAVLITIAYLGMTTLCSFISVVLDRK